MKQYFNFSGSISKPHHWVNSMTGELQPHLWNVLRCMWDYIFKYHTPAGALRWEYSYRGYGE